MPERLGNHGARNRIRVIDRLKVKVLHQTQRCQPKKRVKYVCLVAWPVSEPSTGAVCLQVLAVEDVAAQTV